MYKLKMGLFLKYSQKIMSLFRSNDTFLIGDLVVVSLRCTGKGRKRRQVTKSGIVVEIDSRDPKRVRTDTCPRKFRKVLEICQCHLTSMIYLN